MPPYKIEMPSDVTQALGGLIVQWSHLDETVSSHVRILLGEPDAKKIPKFPEHLRISLDRRIALYRDLAAVLFNEAEQVAATKALDKVCNVRSKREHFIHGTITPQDDGRLLVHVAEEKNDGKIEGENHWYAAADITRIADQMAEADGELFAVFSAYQQRKAQSKAKS